MDNFFSPIVFREMTGYPHDIPEKEIEKLPTFQGNNAVTAKKHIKSFQLCIRKWCNGNAHIHTNVKMRLFSLSLEEDFFYWFVGQYDNKFNTLNELVNAFIERWGDKKEHRHLLEKLHTIKKKENETMEDFNKKFDDLINSLHTEIKPPTTSILIYYIEAFGSELRYQIKDKDPTNLKLAQEATIKIDRNMKASGNSNLLGFTRRSSSTSKQAELKDKIVSTEKKFFNRPFKRVN
jgi:hypothetical protein